MPRPPFCHFSSSASLRGGQKVATIVSMPVSFESLDIYLVVHQNAWSDALSIPQQRPGKRWCIPPLSLEANSTSSGLSAFALVDRVEGGKEYAEPLSDTLPICFLLEVTLVCALVRCIGHLPPEDVFPASFGGC
jgi:hypothetical protein